MDSKALEPWKVESYRPTPGNATTGQPGAFLEALVGDDPGIRTDHIALLRFKCIMKGQKVESPGGTPVPLPPEGKVTMYSISAMADILDMRPKKVKMAIWELGIDPVVVATTGEMYDSSVLDRVRAHWNEGKTLMFDRKIFGARLLEALKAVGMTQKQAAERMHTTEPRISEYVHGKKLPPLDKVSDMVATLGLNPAILFPDWAFTPPKPKATRKPKRPYCGSMRPSD